MKQLRDEHVETFVVATTVVVGALAWRLLDAAVTGIAATGLIALVIAPPIAWLRYRHIRRRLGLRE